MTYNFDVVALGELLIDFSPNGFSGAGYPCFESNPGGAPANVLTSVSRLGGKTAFIGKVGSDSFGRLLAETLQTCGISKEGLLFDPTIKTTLAFVSLDSTGNRSFNFFRNPGADYMLRQDEVKDTLIVQSKIFHFGSLSLTHEPARSATIHAIEVAKNSHTIISYDPNLRLPLWESQEEAKKQIISCLPFADILKISEEEFTFLTGETDFVSFAPDFATKYNISCFFITLGPEGAYYFCNGYSGIVPTYDVVVKDTTGAGDAFTGAALSKISQSEKELCHYSQKDLIALVSFANASGALTATVKGAIPAIPNEAEICACMGTIPLFIVD